MDRRQFLSSVAASGALAVTGNRLLAGEPGDQDRTFATPEEAR